jgi:tetratricopeptide (TPR) repeat protein
MPRDADATGIAGFLKILPRIKTHIQLSAFLATVVIFLLIRLFQPDNVPAQISGGMIGICIIVFSLVFNFLHVFPERDRARVVLVLFSIFAGVVLVLVGVTSYLLVHRTNTAYQAIVETARTELSRKEAELQTELKSVADQKVREAAVLSFSDWKTLTETEERLASQIATIQERRMRMQDAASQAQAIVSEIRLLTQAAAGTTAEVRRQALDAEAALWKGDLEKAQDLFRLVAQSGVNQTASANFWLGRVSELKADFTGAREAYLKALTLAPSEPRYIDAVAKIEEILGNYGAALDHYDSLVQLYRSMPAKKTDLVIALKDAANVSRFMDGTAKAQQYYSEAYQIAKTFRGPDEIAFASVANDFGAFYMSIGGYDNAEKLYAESLTIYGKKNDNAAFGYAELLNNFGYLRLLTADYVTAMELLVKAINIEAEIMGTNVPLFAISTANLANVHMEHGDLGEARIKFETALDVAKRTLGQSHARYGRILGLYGELLLLQGNVSQSATTLKESQDILLKCFGSSHSITALSQIRMAELFIQVQDLEGAAAQLSIAQVTMKNIGGSPIIVARGERAKGELSRMQGRSDESIEALRSALRIQKERLGKRHPEIAKTLFEYGSTLIQTGDFAGARKMFLEAQDMIQSLLLPGHPFVSKLRAKMS